MFVAETLALEKDPQAKTKKKKQVAKHADNVLPSNMSLSCKYLIWKNNFDVINTEEVYNYISESTYMYINIAKFFHRSTKPCSVILNSLCKYPHTV